MRVFKNIVYPYGKDNTADIVIFLSIKGKWSYDNKGRALATFLIGTPNYNDFEGYHEIRAVLETTKDEIIKFYTISVNTKGQYSGSDTDDITKELNDLQIKKIAVELANRINSDRELISSKTQKQTAKQDSAPQPKTETQKANTEKLDKLREGGVISEDEYKRAKGKITPTQTDNKEIDKKLQELSELNKSGVLSEEDYNKAKKRLTELQKLNELHQSGILSEEEYNKAKARLTDKRDVGKE